MSRKTPPIRDEERVLWMALAMADMAIYSHEGEECLLSHEASCEIRRRLVEQFKLNLDKFSEEAREVFDKIYAERKAKSDAEKERAKQVEELLSEVVR
jgi:hypothetical protein